MIAYVVPYLHEFGGIQSFAKSVYRELKSACNIQLIDYSFYYPANKLNLILKIFPQFYPFLVQKNIQEKQREKISRSDLIHFWHPLAAVGFENTNYIVSCHGKEILEANLTNYQKTALDKVFNNAQSIHVNSNFTKKLLLKNFPEINIKKVKVIYPGVNIKHRNSREKRKQNGVVIGTLSRFNPRKNISLIIKALELLQEENNNFKYLLVGQGMEKKQILKNLAEVDFQWNYKEKIAEKNKGKEFYQQIDIFVLPCLEMKDDVEGFGIVYLEANSYGIPVLASEKGGVKESVKEGVSGLYVDPNSPQEIATGILRLIENKNKLHQSAKNWARNFSIKKVSGKMAELYGEK
jgi:phosphatidylinositol alpha-1,6-mannosyltransferase